MDSALWGETHTEIIVPGTTEWVPKGPASMLENRPERIRAASWKRQHSNPPEGPGSQAVRVCSVAPGFVSHALVPSTQHTPKLPSRSYEAPQHLPLRPLSPQPAPASHVGPFFLFPINLDRFPALSSHLAGSFSALGSPRESQQPREAFASPRLTYAHQNCPSAPHIRKPRLVVLPFWCVLFPGTS